MVCSPDRVWQIHEDFRTQLWTHAKIQMHKSKTQVLNRGGVAPDGLERLDAEAQRSDPAQWCGGGTRCFPHLNKESWSLALRWVIGTSSRASWRRCLPSIRVCWKKSNTSVIFNLLGCCCCSSQLHEQTTHFGQCTRLPHSLSQLAMTSF